MRGWRRNLWLLLVPLALLMAGWDTRVVNGQIWRSTYFGGTSGGIPEHTNFATLALDELGVGALFGRDGSASVTTVDLNATYFREDLLVGTAREGDERRTEVEERLLPQPARFAGMPDYSYGPADWFNKNLTCPIGGPANDTADCHSFTGWLGGLNSVHFGSQATAMYAHYHALALQRAGRARALREQMSPDERRIYATALRESEHQALMYEGYAQHFLQDRWAIGHMWERWDGPDRTQATYRSVWGSLVIGGVAGLIHGAEAVVNDKLGRFGKESGLAADPMSSPLRGELAARPMSFRHVASPDSPPVPAIGDERLADMMRGAFGAGYGDAGDQPLDVAEQRRDMLACSKAGWAEVIRALGTGSDGGYGEVGARLAADAPDFAVVSRAGCWDMWATNRSLYVGFVGEGSRGIAGLAALQVVLPRRVRVDDFVFRKTDLAALAWTMWRRQFLDPDGTDLARGGIGSLFRAPTGDRARLPVYAEPVNPADLPTEAQGGVDRQTLFGAMPMAHSDHWASEEAQELLQRLRRSEKDAFQQACQYVADMAWQGTHPSYAGPMSRQRTVAGQPVRSLAQIRLGRREGETDDPLDPYFIDQGYVSRTESRDRDPVFGSKPAANWCAMVPVIRLSRDPELRNRNIIQVLPSDAPRVELIGQDFGAREGNVLIFEDGRGKRTRGRIVDWSDNRIQIDFRRGELKGGRDYVVEIRTADGRRSVGLFILRIRPEEVEEAEVAPAPFVGGCDAVPPPVPGFDFGGAVTRGLGDDAAYADPSTIATALRSAGGSLTSVQRPLRDFMIKERTCILQRQPAGVDAIDRLSRDGQQHFARNRIAESEERRRRLLIGETWAGPYGYLYMERCVVADPRQPMNYDRVPTSAGRAFREPANFWADYARELEGVIQYGRFAETFSAAWALALERPNSVLAPDPALVRAGYDLRITDPAQILRQYFRPIPGAATGPGSDLRRLSWKIQAMTETDRWADSALALYGVTAQGVVGRRDYEDWLVRRVRGESEDPLDASCKVWSALGHPLPSFAAVVPDGSGHYWATNGEKYRRIGWPSLTMIARPGQPSTPTPGPITSQPPVPFSRPAPAAPAAPVPLPPIRPGERGLPPIMPRAVPGSPVGRRRRVNARRYP